MKLTLQREGQIKVLDAISTITVYEDNRPDVYNLLKFIEEKGVSCQLLKERIGENYSDFVIEGIVKFLEENQFIDKNHTLTAKGRKFLETQKFPSEERGQFRFWILEDPLVKKSVLHFQREKKREKENEQISVDDEDVSNMEKIDFISVKDDTKFNIVKMDRASNSSHKFHCIKHDSYTSDCKIIWEITLSDNKESKIYLTGKLTESKNHTEFNKKALEQVPDVNLDSLVIGLIENNCPEYLWNDTLRAFEIDVNVNDDEIENLNKININEIENFSKNIELTNTDTCFGKFNISTVIDVPIMPGNNNVAKKWFEIYVENNICNGYIDSNEFNAALDSLKKRKEFAKYDKYIKEIDSKHFIDRFRNCKMDKYWGLHAPLDLKPGIKFGIIVENLTGKKSSMHNLVQEIVGDKKPEKFVFSSKYLNTKYQIKKFELFAAAFKLSGVEDIRLISFNKPQLSDNSIIIELYDNIYGDTKFWPHDRYFAFKASGSWYYYKMSAELDQCHYDSKEENDWTVDTVGEWKDLTINRLGKKETYEKFFKYTDTL